MKRVKLSLLSLEVICSEKREKKSQYAGLLAITLCLGSDCQSLLDFLDVPNIRTTFFFSLGGASYISCARSWPFLFLNKFLISKN